MTEPTQPDPAVVTGQAPAPVTQPTSQVPAQPNADAPTPPTPEEIAALQQRATEADQLRAQLTQQQQNYEHLRVDHTRKSQALAQLTGAGPIATPSDPLAPYVKGLVAKGYSEADARAVAEVSYSMIQPLMEQNQQLAASQQALSQVGEIMRQAWLTDAELFADPRISQKVEADLRQCALNKQPITPEYAVNMALLEQYHMKKLPAAQQPPAWQPPPFASFGGSAGGYTPAPAPQGGQPQMSPNAQALADKMAGYLNIKPKTA